MKTRFRTVLLLLACFAAGWIAAQLGPDVLRAQAGGVKGARFLHGLSLQVRRADEPNFTRDTKRIGIEVVLDENNGNVIYITETGSIAVIPAAR
jgi:hypothetical protein